QVPSAVSAIKIGGVRSYARARRGEAVVLAPRRVRISRLDVVATRVGMTEGHEVFDVDIEVDCSSGTYVRAIARALGAALGVGGHLIALRRTAVGTFTLAEAVTLEELAQRPEPVSIPLATAVARCLPRRDVDAALARTLSHGGTLPAAGIAGPYGVFAPDGQ